MSDNPTTTTRLSRAQLADWLAEGGRRNAQVAQTVLAYMTALESIADGGCDHYTHNAGRVVHKDCPALIAAAALGRLP